MAREYVKAESEAREATGGKRGALAMTLTNVERQAVIQEIRTLQKESGTISQADHVFTTRAPTQLDAVTRKLAASYRVGMIAIPSIKTGDLEAGKEARITAVDTVKNSITLTGQDGKTATIDARKQSKGLMIYEERQTDLSEGEKIVWLKSDNTAQGKHNKIKNGLSGTIENINGNQITVRTELGHSVQINGEGSYITNAQAITGHKAQGATEHTAIASISSDDRLASKNMLYVILTRETDDAVLFVDNKEKLIEAAQQQEAKTSTLEENGKLLSELKEMIETQKSEVANRKATDQQAIDEVNNQAVNNQQHDASAQISL